MNKKIQVAISTITLLSFDLLFLAGAIRAEAIIADHNVVAESSIIPDSVIEKVKTSYKIFYGHTSHGNQIVTGMDMLRDENNLYDYNNGSGTLTLSEYGDDLGHNGDTTWVPPTRNWLVAYPDYNVVIWSWCGGCSDNTEEGINLYLNAMNQLEQDYPEVKFIYMTGHLDGTGPSGNLYARNNQIRAYCSANSKVLFDFADIESYDPDGNYYPDETDYCNWCYAWCSSHTCPGCGDCAHSHCFNCYLKGKAFWWMMAKVSGWNQIPDLTPHILSTSPVKNEVGVIESTNISATFDKEMDGITINDTTFIVNAASSGNHPGTINYDSLTRTVAFDPSNDFDVSEMVTVILTTGMKSSEGVSLDSNYTWFFSTATTGDVNGDGQLTVSDVVCLINYLFKGGPAPDPVKSGDTNCDGKTSVSDVVYLINYLFKSGPPSAC